MPVVSTALVDSIFVIVSHFYVLSFELLINFLVFDFGLRYKSNISDFCVVIIGCLSEIIYHVVSLTFQQRLCFTIPIH